MEDEEKIKTQGSLFALPHIWFSFGIYSLGHVARLCRDAEIRSVKSDPSMPLPSFSVLLELASTVGVTE